MNLQCKFGDHRGGQAPARPPCLRPWLADPYGIDEEVSFSNLKNQPILHLVNLTALNFCCCKLFKRKLLVLISLSFKKWPQLVSFDGPNIVGERTCIANCNCRKGCREGGEEESPSPFVDLDNCAAALPPLSSLSALLVDGRID